MGYIDREQALSHPFANGEYDHKHANEHFILGFESYREWLEQLPTIDIVRCGECKWCEKRETANYLPFYYCVNDEISVKDTDYCSWGEGKE